MSMSIITIKTNVAKVAADLQKAERKQIPFASALTLTTLAKKAQATLRAELGDYFTIRRPWVSRGITITPARKADWPFLKAEVGTRDDFMARQALGGRKVGRGGKDVAQPIAARENPNMVTPQSQWPGKQLARKRYFVTKIRTGKLAGKKAVMYRPKDAGQQLKVMWLLRGSVEVKKTWKFESTVQREVGLNYEKEFGRALSRALASSR